MKYKILSYFIGWIFPTAQDRKNFKYFCKGIDSKKIHSKIVELQKQTVKRLREEFKVRKIKVVFLNSENSKWQYQTLYEAFSANPHFEVQILVSLKKNMLHSKLKSFDYKENLKNNYEFFKKKGMNVDCAFDLEKNEFLSLKHFGADIVFYEQPWQLPEIYSIINVSEYALPFYMSYASLLSNGSFDYTLDLLKDVYTYFVDNKYTKIFSIARGFDPERLTVSGQVKLDAYLRPIDESKVIWDKSGKYKKRVIWAPHHAFDERSTLRYGTFHWTYKFMYDFMKQHPEYEFVLKPHPALKSEIVTKHFMTEKQMNKYFEKLGNLPNVKTYEKTDYYDIFRTSDLMITDCCSFLLEYLPTEKPIIQLIRENSIGQNYFGQKVTKGYYKTYNLDELQTNLDMILKENKDPLKETRLKTIKEDLFQPENGVNNYVVDYVTGILKNTK